MSSLIILLDSVTILSTFNPFYCTQHLILYTWTQDSLDLKREELANTDSVVQLNVVRGAGNFGRVVVRWVATGDHDGINDIMPIQGKVRWILLCSGWFCLLKLISCTSQSWTCLYCLGGIVAKNLSCYCYMVIYKFFIGRNQCLLFHKPWRRMVFHSIIE